MKKYPQIGDEFYVISELATGDYLITKVFVIGIYMLLEKSALRGDRKDTDVFLRVRQKEIDAPKINKCGEINIIMRPFTIDDRDVFIEDIGKTFFTTVDDAEKKINELKKERQKEVTEGERIWWIR